MKKIFKKIAVSLAIIFMLVFANGCYYVFHGQFKSVEKLNQGKELNLYECCSIYTMHMAVWMFGWPISPIAAYEAFLLHFPHKEPVVYDGIDMYEANGKSKKVPTKGADYADMSIKELRVALAISSQNTYFEVTEAYSMCVVQVQYTDAVNKVWKVPINTVLFKYLQEKHVLHPYQMIFYYMYV